MHLPFKPIYTEFPFCLEPICLHQTSLYFSKINLIILHVITLSADLRSGDVLVTFKALQQSLAEIMSGQCSLKYMSALLRHFTGQRVGYTISATLQFIFEA